jgi:hypothetical protein
MKPDIDRQPEGTPFEYGSCYKMSKGDNRNNESRGLKNEPAVIHNSWETFYRTSTSFK